MSYRTLRANAIQFAVVLSLPVVLFTLLIWSYGVNPIPLYRTMITAVAGNLNGLTETAILAAPLILTALATAIPARGRLINVGAEGQLFVGATAATGIMVYFGSSLPSIVYLPLLVAAGAMGGAVWAGIAGYLKIAWNMNEVISTLLMNYIAHLFMRYCVHGPLNDPEAFNYPYSPDFVPAARFPQFFNTRFHLGVIIPVLLIGIFWYVLNYMEFGFKLDVIGKNTEAARRSGIPVSRYLMYTMLIGGALAGMAGTLEVAGVSGRLRPSTGVSYGYTGFLAAWMVRHNLFALLGAAVLFAAITVSGDTIQIFGGLPASSVRVLMSLVVLSLLAVRIGGFDD